MLGEPDVVPKRAVPAPGPHIAVEVGNGDVVTAKLRGRVDASAPASKRRERG